MGLRWLNGHAVEYKVKGEVPKGKKAMKEAQEDRKKRLIVEFAIENANVVARREDRGKKGTVRDRSGAVADPGTKGGFVNSLGKQSDAKWGRGTDSTEGASGKAGAGSKRKRDADVDAYSSLQKKRKQQTAGAQDGGDADASAGASTSARTRSDGKGAKREQIIRKKRMARQARKAGKAGKA
jgi:nucleolar protein 4